jgi:hypothetical protein
MSKRTAILFNAIAPGRARIQKMIGSELAEPALKLLF